MSELTYEELLHVCRYCEGRRRVLLDHVHEGYENDWWEYNEEMKYVK